MAAYCNDVRQLKSDGLVRQRGGLSSFHIPDQHVNHQVWKLRYGGKRDDPDSNSRLLEERLALEYHAKTVGCQLIINPELQFSKWGPIARRSRIEVLLDFLKRMPDEKCEVAILSKAGVGSLTMVGDWFCAEAVSGTAGRGYKQTIFCRHAPTVMKKIQEFDGQFKELLDKRGWSADTSRLASIALLENILADLPKAE